MGFPAYKIKKMSAQLRVADLDRSVAFYTEVLGFEIEFRYEDFYVGMIKGGHSIHLKKAWSSLSKPDGEADPDLILAVEGIEGLYNDLSARSNAIAQPLRNMPYGKEFYIADPDGHTLAFVEEP